MKVHTSKIGEMVFVSAMLLLGFAAGLRGASAAESGESAAESGEADEKASDESRKAFDILKPLNYAFYYVNDPFQRFIAKPIGVGFDYVIPRPVRHGINNFQNNILTVFSGLNNFLQGKFKDGGTEFARFGINTTVGLLGFFEVAEPWKGLEARPEDFGQTLGKWHIHEGPYLCLPLIGPTTLRDLPFTFTMSHKAPEWHYLNKLDDDIRFASGLSLFTINGLSLTYGNYGEGREKAKSEGMHHYKFIRDGFVDMRYRKTNDLEPRE